MSITPGVWNDWSIEVGADFYESVLLKDSGGVIDLTGCQVLAQYRDANDRDGTLLGHFDVSVEPHPDNTITLRIPDTETVNLEPNTKVFFDLLVINASGVDDYYLEGKIPVRPSVTNKLVTP